MSLKTLKPFASNSYENKGTQRLQLQDDLSHKLYTDAMSPRVIGPFPHPSFIFWNVYA